MQQESAETKRTRGPGFFLPMLLLVLSLLLMAGGQLSQLQKQAVSLESLKAGQEKPLEDARNVRRQFDAITTGTAQLAAQGNPHAAMLLKELEKLGVTVSLPAASPPQP